MAAREEWARRLGDGVPAVLVTSSATGRGVPELAAAVALHVPLDSPPADPAPAAPVAEHPSGHRVYRPAAQDAFRVERAGPRTFRVSGLRAERLIARHDLSNPDALAYVENRLRALGVIRALEAAGFEPGDDVEIAGVVFELHPGG